VRPSMTRQEADRQDNVSRRQHRVNLTRALATRPRRTSKGASARQTCGNMTHQQYRQDYHRPTPWN
jgi:hypothetical protein